MTASDLPHDPHDFARHWVAAWNGHDLEAILALFHDEVLFTSPLASRLDLASGGVVSGKAALRAYWAEALARIPDLHFEILSLFAGVDSLLIGFRNQQGMERFEVLRFRDGLVIEGHGTYPVAFDRRS